MFDRTRLLVAAVVALGVAGGNAAAPEEARAAGAGPVELRGALSHSSYNGATRLRFKVDYMAVTAAPSERAPLNIALVLDASGSMSQDQKMKYTLDAARAVIENLSERDVLSIISFNDKVTVLAPAGKVVNKAFLNHRLEEVLPASYTDISAGLLEGLAQIKSQSANGQIRHVLLLTDGMANRGIVDSAGMRRIAAQASAEGIGVSTLGCGAEFNAQRLTEIAEAAGGRYTFIKTPEQIPTAFAEELHGLLAVVAQNVRLELVADNAVITRLNGQPLAKPAASQSFNIGNVRAGERGLFVPELKADSSAQGAAVTITARLIFDDPVSAQRVSREARAEAPFAAGNEVAENVEVLFYAQVLDALVTAEEAAKGLDTERHRQAQARSGELYERARNYALQNKDQELLNQTFLLKHFMQEFAAAEREGLLHGHQEARAKFEKEADYRRYLLQHHQGSPERH